MLTPLTQRPRRLRRHSLIRDMVSETTLRRDQLIQPYFLSWKGDEKAEEPIAGFSGVSRWGIDALCRRVETDRERGVRNFLLFGATAQKDAQGSEAASGGAILPRAVAALKSRFGQDILLMSDVCLCPYTADGHCGITREKEISNDESVEALCQAAQRHAEAGVDFVAPSDMMDGRIGAIRRTLDQKGFSGVGILSYTAKYRSAYYGPFREALDSAPSHGDRSTYQMDFRNSREALRQLALDSAQGADIVMVKPALAYLDVIRSFKESTDLPVAAYCVSGEYQMIKLAAESGIASERELVIESLTAIRRAGAQVIVTYHASLAAEKGWF